MKNKSYKNFAVITSPFSQSSKQTLSHFQQTHIDTQTAIGYRMN